MIKCLSYVSWIQFVFPILFIVYVYLANSDAQEFHYIPKNQKLRTYYSGRQLAETLSWVVRLKVESSSSKHEHDLVADAIAKDTKLLNLGQVGELSGYYLFASPLHQHILNLFSTASAQDKNEIRMSMVRENLTMESQGNLSQSDWHNLKVRSIISLDKHPNVKWYIQQLFHVRSKRDLIPGEEKTKFVNYTERALKKDKRWALDDDLYNPLHFNDPAFSKQWHLVNTYNPKRDINVTDVWLHNITGHGVTIAVIDDGLEWNNPDLLLNYNPDGSFDLNSNDPDPSPSSAKSTNQHGTRCAGEIVAVANNGICGVGVAYGAKVSGIRILDGPMTDDLEAVAFTKKLDVNDIYSCSWGPEDDGKTVDGPQHLATTAMRHGVTYGRNGYGAIYVVASGNGGRVDDNCNYDGYANSIYTVTVGAIDEDGEMPTYGEPCASMLAVTYSSGSTGYSRNIVTTDWTKNGGTGCTENHSGTSAAAPIASSLIALMLEAQPCLTWRDVQYIIAVSAVKVDVLRSEWVRNGAGLFHSHQHGFGELKAWRMVNTAKVWKPVPWLTLYTSDEIQANVVIPAVGSLVSEFNVTEEMLDGYYLNTLEYVHVRVTLDHERRGDLGIELICPSRTVSVIGAPRKMDDSRDGFKDWIFSTVRCWGENPAGIWTLRITDSGALGLRNRGTLKKWQLQLYGSRMTSKDVADRIRLVTESASGRYLNSSPQLPCPPVVQTQRADAISERLLKVLFMTGCFLLFMACYETLEYAFCYNEEKKEHANLLSLGQRARQLAGEHTSEETTQLLPAEEIEMVPVVIEHPAILSNGSVGVASARDLEFEIDESIKEEFFDAKNEHNVGSVPCVNSDEDLLLSIGDELSSNGTTSIGGHR